MYYRMKRFLLLPAAVAMATGLFAQTITTGLSAAFTQFEKDSQLKSAVASMYVIEAVTGDILFEANSRTGLAPASTQKIITSAAAYELLGKNFRYQTQFGYYSSPNNSRSGVGIFIRPSGDPTLGSWRWKRTSEDSVLARVTQALSATGVKSNGSFAVDATGWEGETIPGGWSWDDIGNYYGAGAEALNWRENQYDLIMKSGKNIGDPVVIVGTKPALYNYNFISNATSAAAGTGDNCYIYFPINASAAVVRGTIPVSEDRFVISGAMPSAKAQFLATLNDSLSKPSVARQIIGLTINKFSKNKLSDSITLFHTELSPPLDSINYWFLKRSINLYGEALAKTIAANVGKTATTENGVAIIRNFWKDKNVGLDITELHMEDGSGLSPLNRVTTHAQVAILQYAKKQSWFDSYFNSFPEFNGMKLKSGTIHGVKSFCGYHTSKEGRSYILSFIVNNYNGASSALVQKMYKVLDVLK